MWSKHRESDVLSARGGGGGTGDSSLWSPTVLEGCSDEGLGAVSKRSEGSLSSRRGGGLAQRTRCWNPRAVTQLLWASVSASVK